MKALCLIVLILTGCGTGVTSRTVREFGGALEDAALYRRSKLDHDEAANQNLADAYSTLAAVEAELELMKASIDGKVPTADAQRIIQTLQADLLATGQRLADTRRAQMAADVHYQGMVRLMREAHALLQALADRDESDTEARQNGLGAASRAAGILRKAAATAATGGTP